MASHVNYYVVTYVIKSEKGDHLNTLGGYARINAVDVNISFDLVSQ